MAISLLFCGISLLNQWNMSSFIMINSLLACYHMSQGAVAWLYIPEVCVDAATGFAAAGQFVNLSVISLTFEFMINSSLEVYGTMWYFAGWSVLGLFFV